MHSPRRPPPPPRFVAPFFLSLHLSAIYFPPLLACNWKHLNVPPVMWGGARWPQGAEASGAVFTRAPWRLRWLVGPAKAPVTGGALCLTFRAWHNQFTCLCPNTHTDYIIRKHYDCWFFPPLSANAHFKLLNRTFVWPLNDLLAWKYHSSPHKEELLLLRIMWLWHKTDNYIDLGQNSHLS